MSTYPLGLIRELFDYTTWADSMVWRAVLAHEPARTDVALVGYLRHIHMVQHAFLLAWRGESPEPAWRQGSTIMEAAALWRWAQPFYEEAGALIASLDQDALARPMVMPWAGPYEAKLGRPFAVTSLGDTMFQVVSHSTYHRGQVNARLRAVGGEPPTVDHIVWTWFGRPAPEAVVDTRAS
jgi:uncharacterized damage-inducible protein DinB